MTRARTVRARLVLGALSISIAACVPDAGTAPAGLAPRTPELSLGAVGTVFNQQLRAFPNDPIFPTDPVYGSGNLHIRLGSVLGDSCYPTDPITPQPGTTVLAICGKIFNQGGALYRGGGIYQTNLFGDGFVQVAAFNGTLPPNPCHRYDVAGSITVSDAVASDMILHPSQYKVQMDGDVAGTTTVIAGLFDGSAWGTATRPGDPYQPSDPYFAEKVCTVAITP
jgi:hypothetical protein